MPSFHQIIPNDSDHQALYSDFKTLVKRALVENIPALKDFKDFVEHHIRHTYSKQSEKKSNIVRDQLVETLAILTLIFNILAQKGGVQTLLLDPHLNTVPY